MRMTSRILTAAFVVGIIGVASLVQAGCTGCSGSADYGNPALGAEPCCSPPGYCMAPGCCEVYKPCCDNAWAGYCEHKAKVQAFWARVGVKKPKTRRSFFSCFPWCRPCYEEPLPCEAPTPAVAPIPNDEPTTPIAPMPEEPKPHFSPKT